MERTEDKVYRMRRERLIPKAEKFADSAVGKEPCIGENREEWVDRWNYTFHQKMNELACTEKLFDQYLNEVIVPHQGEQ